MFFRAGTRKNEQMQPIVEQLNNEDIRNLGAYFASLAPPKARKPDDNPDLSKKGAQAAVGRRCASCHTDTYAGTKAVARIAGQREEYLVKALHDYKSGVRAGGAMAAMADVAFPLSEEEIEALAHYLAHLAETSDRRWAELSKASVAASIDSTTRLVPRSLGRPSRTLRPAASHTP